MGPEKTLCWPPFLSGLTYWIVDSFNEHPFDQESIWEQMLGKGVLESCYRRNRAWFNIIFMPYALIFFCLLPPVVLLDIVFRKADLLFVSPKALKERRTKENPFFGFVRSQIHLKMLRLMMHHWSQLFYVITLFLVVQNPNRSEENRMNHWYNYVAAAFSLSILFNETLAWKLRGRKVSKWCLQHIATQVLFLAGWTTTLCYQSIVTNVNVDRADISGNSLISIAETFLAAGVFMAYFRSTVFPDFSLSFLFSGYCVVLSSSKALVRL